MNDVTATLSVRNLTVTFPGDRGERVTAVDGVDFDVNPGEVLGVVGESGAGKSISVMATLGLVPPSARVTADLIEFEGRSLLTTESRELRRIRNRRIGVVFQDPMTSLNPTFTIGYQISRTLRMFDRTMDRRRTRARVVELLELVGIPNAARRARQFPHEFSGGMRQRAMIAMAIANGPALLIADEPTTALDVTIQSQILDVLQRVAAETGAATVLITHDLGVVAETSDRVMVVYAGQVVEQAPIDAFFREQHHFYSRALLASLPSIDVRTERMIPITGSPISAAVRPSGCAFHPRCPLGRTEQICHDDEPELLDIGARLARCHFSSVVPTFDLEAQVAS